MANNTTWSGRKRLSHHMNASVQRDIKRSMDTLGVTPMDSVTALELVNNPIPVMSISEHEAVTRCMHHFKGGLPTLI